MMRILELGFYLHNLNGLYSYLVPMNSPDRFVTFLQNLRNRVSVGINEGERFVFEVVNLVIDWSPVSFQFILLHNKIEFHLNWQREGGPSIDSTTKDYLIEGDNHSHIGY